MTMMPYASARREKNPAPEKRADAPMRVHAPFFAVLAACVVSLGLPGCASSAGNARAAPAQAPIPLGGPGLTDHWTTDHLAPGVRRHEIRREPGAALEARWTWRSTPLRTIDQRADVSSCLENAGLSGVKTRFPYPGNAEKTYDITSVGDYRSVKDAQAAPAAGVLRACGFKLQRINDTPGHQSGPWRINILEIDPARFDGRLTLGLAAGRIAKLKPVADIAAHENALAAVNASFFVLSDKDGVIGDIAGLGIFEGRLVSEGLVGRSALVLRETPGLQAHIEPYDPVIMLDWADGSTMIADGINRRPGVIRNCGHIDRSHRSVAFHDVTCTHESELIVYDRYAGFEPDLKEAAAFHVAADGAISSKIPADWPDGEGFLVVATGDRASEVDAKLGVHRHVHVRDDIDHETAPAFAVNGAPLLLYKGRKVDLADEEGWPLDEAMEASQADAIHKWINLRNPRTAAGIREDGRILLVTIDGRQPRRSVGVTIKELRDLMQALGAVDAINLDGGGSTTMVLGAELANIPSDPSGPRPVADALLLLPSQR